MCKVLIFSCISAVMLLTAAYGAPLQEEKLLLLDTLIDDIKLLEKSKDSIYLEFYTPTEKQECSWQTLQCYWKEIGTLENEIEDEHFVTLQNIRKNLQRLMEPVFIQGMTLKTVPEIHGCKGPNNKLTPQGTGCKTCEANDTENFPAFHQELLNFLRSLRKRNR